MQNELVAWVKEHGIREYLRGVKRTVDMNIYHECFETGKKPFSGIRYFWAMVEGMILSIGADLECLKDGHQIEDYSSCGPDSGNMDHCCTHCGAYWSCPLY